MLAGYIMVTLAVWLTVLNLLGAIVLSYDKVASMNHWTRVPEHRLHVFEWCGGALLMLPVMFLISHKCAKSAYYVTSIIAFVVWVIAIYLLSMLMNYL